MVGRARARTVAVLGLLACNPVRSDAPNDDDAFVTATATDSTTTTTTTADPTLDTAEVTSGSTGTGSTGDAKFDLGITPDLEPDPGCPAWNDQASKDIGFSYAWIANSSEGTVSKIDTRTATELGRYRTGPMAAPDPSRTSVSLYGDVVVVNRQGGIARIAARHTDCPDRNGNGEVDTSMGPTDIVPWGDDECVLWHTPLTAPSQDNYNGARPVAWEGTVDEEGCPLQHPRVWVGEYTGSGLGQGLFYRLDGETGLQDAMVTVGNWSAETWGPYGGAIDGHGDFWAVGFGLAPLVRIDGQTLGFSRHAPVGGDHAFYGLALDDAGNPWTTGCNGHVYTMDVTTGDWTDLGDAGGCLRGIGIDREGRGWAAASTTPCHLVEIDTAARVYADNDVALPGCIEPVGIGIDVDGYVWVVDVQAGAAFKVDPDTHAIDAQVTGLVDPYTYSDMTGGGLNLVVNPPQ